MRDMGDDDRSILGDGVLIRVTEEPSILEHERTKDVMCAGAPLSLGRIRWCDSAASTQSQCNRDRAC